MKGNMKKEESPKEHTWLGKTMMSHHPTPHLDKKKKLTYA